jgi:hypothetical protein
MYKAPKTLNREIDLKTPRLPDEEEDDAIHQTPKGDFVTASAFTRVQRERDHLARELQVSEEAVISLRRQIEHLSKDDNGGAGGGGSTSAVSSTTADDSLSVSPSTGTTGRGGGFGQQNASPTGKFSRSGGAGGAKRLATADQSSQTADSWLAVNAGTPPSAPVAKSSIAQHKYGSPSHLHRPGGDLPAMSPRPFRSPDVTGATGNEQPVVKKLAALPVGPMLTLPLSGRVSARVDPTPRFSLGSAPRKGSFRSLRPDAGGPDFNVVAASPRMKLSFTGPPPLSGAGASQEQHDAPLLSARQPAGNAMLTGRSTTGGGGGGGAFNRRNWARSRLTARTAADVEDTAPARISGPPSDAEGGDEDAFNATTTSVGSPFNGTLRGEGGAQNFDSLAPQPHYFTVNDEEGCGVCQIAQQVLELIAQANAAHDRVAAASTDAPVQLTPEEQSAIAAAEALQRVPGSGSVSVAQWFVDGLVGYADDHEEWLSPEELATLRSTVLALSAPIPDATDGSVAVRWLPAGPLESTSEFLGQVEVAMRHSDFEPERAAATAFQLQIAADGEDEDGAVEGGFWDLEGLDANTPSVSSPTPRTGTAPASPLAVTTTTAASAADAADETGSANGTTTTVGGQRPAAARGGLAWFLFGWIWNALALLAKLRWWRSSSAASAVESAAGGKKIATYGATDEAPTAVRIQRVPSFAGVSPARGTAPAASWTPRDGGPSPRLNGGGRRGDKAAAKQPPRWIRVPADCYVTADGMMVLVGSATAPSGTADARLGDSASDPAHTEERRVLAVAAVRPCQLRRVALDDEGDRAGSTRLTLHAATAAAPKPVILFDPSGTPLPPAWSPRDGVPANAVHSSFVVLECRDTAVADAIQESVGLMRSSCAHHASPALREGSHVMAQLADAACCLP